MRLGLFRGVACTGVLSILISGSAVAAPVLYSSQSSFLAAVGASITDDYSNPGYVHSGGAQGFHPMTDAYMSSVLNQTRYTATYNANIDLVNAPLATSNPYFCTGCNASFSLGFQSTSETVNGGVYGVSFNYRNGIPGQGSPGFDLLVTFGDGSTADYTLPLSGTPSPPSFTPDFWGITSNLEIASIYVGNHGASSNSTQFGIDNLTIAGAQQLPEPATVTLFGAGIAGFAAIRRRRRKPN